MTLKDPRGHNVKYAPYVFTEQGVAMLSSVLKGKRAVQVNIAIMRAFVRLSEMELKYANSSRWIRQLTERPSGTEDFMQFDQKHEYASISSRAQKAGSLVF